MNIYEIMIDWLKAHGYDGLYVLDVDNEIDCFCDFNNIMDSDWCGPGCKPGHKIPCKKNAHGYRIGPKPKRKKKDNNDAGLFAEVVEFEAIK